MDGANDSTTFIDSSSSSHVVSALGGAKISTAQSKFGGASGLFVGNFGASTGQSALSIANHADFDFGSGDFTIEGFVRLASLASVSNVSHGLICKRATTAVFAPFNLEMSYAAGPTRLKGQVSTSGSSWITCQSTTNLSPGLFYHIALCRAGTNLRMFLDGVQQGSTQTVSGALMTNTAAVTIGAASVARDYGLSGYLDDWRITKGVARYTENFTAPTAAFLNS